MAVVHHHVAAEGARGVVVDAARAVGDVAHDHALCAAEPLDDVDDRAAVHEEPLGHLQRNPDRAVLLDLRDGLGDLKIVIRREKMRDRAQQKRIRLLERELRCHCESRRSTARVPAHEALAGHVGGKEEKLNRL